MLESLVAWVLNNYLGKYVENLNTDQLSIAILSGEVELENLPLRKDALRHLGIPIEIRAGLIGKVKLQIPIRSLRSSPWVIIIERLYLVAGPLNLEEWDQNAEDLADQERKLAALDALEACWRLEADSSLSGGTHYASSYSTWLSYGTGVITDIVENMQLHLKDIHIRYEDSTSLNNVACVCGLTIESLSAQSCDQNWAPQFTTHRDGTDLSYKTIELKNLAIYWDTIDPENGLTSKLSPIELATTLAEDDKDKHRYLVAPVSACAKLQRNRSDLPLRSVMNPRIVCDLNLDQVQLVLIDWQYEQIICCVRGLEILSRVQQYRRRRPSVPISADPRAWWSYACVCHVPGAQRIKTNWTEALERAKQNVQYVELYTKLLSQPSAALGVETKRLKDLVEYSRDFSELRALREVSMRRCTPLTNLPVPPPQEPSPNGRSVLVRWFPQWWGWYSAPGAPGAPEPPPETQVPVQLEDEILEALADSARNNTLLRRDVVFGRFNFTLNGGLLELRASGQSTGAPGVTMIELQFSELVAEVVSRPRTSSFSLELSLGALYLRDRLTQGTLFPVLVGPPGTTLARQQFRTRILPEQPFFTLNYSSITSSLSRLHVTSRPLDVVYQPAAVRWLLEFACAPHQRSAARHRLEEMRERTKQQLTDTWGSILENKETRHRGWDLRLDISAPQLILVERFCDPSAAIAVVDLGTLRLENGAAPRKSTPEEEEDDDEAFMTPFSTPPGSEIDLEDCHTLVSDLNELSIHQRIYDTYNIELSDIQVLIGRVKDNWRHAHTKGSSNLHVLDRFNISLVIERRIVPTTDPMYPSVTLNANLPRLVAHINEQKITSVRTILKILSESSLLSPNHETVIQEPNIPTCSPSEDLPELSRLLTVQFTVDQMSLEVQSRGRSVAELQVSRTTLSLSRRPSDLSLSLTVHGLLLVDALQTFGGDFELLVASHRHVGMDSLSGSLRDSEPTSPTSPGSPDPAVGPRVRATSPVALSRALREVQSPPPGGLGGLPPGADAEALICVEYVLVKGEETVQVASIQFNNLDIIANQETVVELVGFIRRVFPKKPIRPAVIIPKQRSVDDEARIRSRTTSKSEVLDEDDVQEVKSRTELTFDFHKLNVLLLRASVEDGKTIGRKIGTATMCEAKIQATIDSKVFVVGSLGGLQVLDLTPEGHLHQRILSVGRDPFADILFNPDLEQAFNFNIKRSLQEDLPVELSVKMASVWYTHSPQFLTELKSCASEFKQYLSDVAKSIRSAATDVALGLVHARTEQIAQTFGMSYDVASPRRLRRRSASSEPHTPFTPIEEDFEETGFDLHLDIVLDSPVIILPRSSDSTNVLVAHLGKITINKTDTLTYEVEIRDMNICTLDISLKRLNPTVQMIYNCDNALPILHDTLLKLQVTKYPRNVDDIEIIDETELLKINGSVINDLRVSLTRAQYEQLLDTLDWLGKDDSTPGGPQTASSMDIIAEEIPVGVSTLSMDPQVRAKLFPSIKNRLNINSTNEQFIKVFVQFEIDSFAVELCNLEGAGLVGLNFGEFLLTYSVPKKYESELQVTLKSLLVEDLLCEKTKFGRQMIASKPTEDNLLVISSGLSKSYPETSNSSLDLHHFGSLPDKLDTRQIFGVGAHHSTPRQVPVGPKPQRPRGENLVVVNCKFFKTDFEEMVKNTNVDFGALDVVLSPSSWIPLMEFFRVTNDTKSNQSQIENKIGNSSTKITISSLTLVALRSTRTGLVETLARARAAGAHLDITRQGPKRKIHGQLGVLQIRHPGKQNFSCRGERFVTIGQQALLFTYTNYFEGPADSELSLEISPFVYVHTKKFIAELKAFFQDFYQQKPKKKPSKIIKISKMAFKLSADASICLFPVQNTNSDLLVLDVARLTAENTFISTNIAEEVLNLDVTTWKLHQVDFYIARAQERDIITMNTNKEAHLVFGDCCVTRISQSLLANKCLLEFRVDKNLEPSFGHRKNGIADLTINCRLSTLEISLKVDDYALIKGVLTHNLGEDTEYILPTVYNKVSEDIWTISSLRIELLDVKVHLESISCIHFARSRLILDGFSDLSQDIDLVSRQILITDERKVKSNVFETILKPIHKNLSEGSVQVEIHSRRRQEKNKFTVLLNNMRLMAIPDWWKLAAEFIFAKFDPNTVEEQTDYLPDKVEVPFELKINITDSEIVVVEDSSSRDTNAVILRSTTLITYRPNSTEPIKPLSCSVNHLELFSCRFCTIEDTALSIIDPVTISAEISNNILEIQVHELTIRVSYRDILLFAAIFDSFSRQAGTKPKEVDTNKDLEDIEKLTALGFAETDCKNALEVCEQLDDAALWLTQNAQPRAVPQRAHQPLDIKTVELKASIVRFCLIDDCADVDVPLSEALLTNLLTTYDLTSVSNNLLLDADSGAVMIENTLSGPKTASIECTLALDYYNRVLGGWEPFLESWKCRAIWRPENNLTYSRHRIALHSDDILDLNITDSMLRLVRLVQESWTKDIGAPKATPRSPFVPYSITNSTGSNLYFAMVISDPDAPVKSLDDFEDDNNDLYKGLTWREVPPGETTSFSYHSSHSKQRHAESHQLRSHQLCVRVYGWQTCVPVSVDRVGTYFRCVAPDRRAEPQRITAPRAARLVFDVKLDGSAKKLIVIRSAMVLVNKLKDSVDVKLVERSAVNAVSTSSRTALLEPGKSFPLPIIHSHSHIFVRPTDDDMSYSYSTPDVPWARVLRPGDKTLFPLRCSTNRGASYYVCCEIRREKYPVGDVGHTIILLPVLLIVNLLPQDLYYSLTCEEVVTRGRIPPGGNTAVPNADPDNVLDLSFNLDNFKCTTSLNIPNATLNTENINEYTSRIRLEDSEHRRLFLQARIEPGRGSRLRITITAPFWIINRTGLPLVFKQEGFSADTAGQFEEHEVARMVAPLLFSFADQEASPMVVARVGYRYGGRTPHFCQQFHLRRGIQVRRLRVTSDQGAESVYVVGIEVRAAKGRRRYQHTNIVTVSPRYQLYNRSVMKLEFAQKCHAGNLSDPCRVVATPGCHVPFHWPRLDREQLLCLRTSSTSWTGGLRIDAPLSCHVLLREEATGARFCFLHAEVVPQGATYCLVVSDAGDLPPPLRVDNSSEVAITFGQAGANAGPTVAHAHRAVPYSWDEPSGTTKMVVTAPGGVSACYDVDKLGRGTQLTYENFIYVAFTGTFHTEDDLDHYNESDYSTTKFATKRPSNTVKDPINPVKLQRLVLEVPENTCNVLLAKKQPGKRSQLWRMTSTGQLQHEGSCAPGGGALVLDIEAPAPQPSAPKPSKLALRRPDPRRKSTQTWRFTNDGRLCCAHRNTCVQSMDGLLGLRPGSPAVLGASYDSPAYRAPQIIPLEQTVGKQRMRPGSGLLAVEVTTDGPTRVIRVTDMKQRDPSVALGVDEEDWRGVAPAHRPKTSELSTGFNEMQLTVMLRAGLGLSIVGDCKELLYLQLNNIIAEAIFGNKSQEFCVSIQDIQCDNQLPETTVPVLLHAAKPRNQKDLERSQTLPVLELRAEMSPSASSLLIFKHLIVCLRPLSIHLEENLMLRMYEFFLTATGEILTPDDDDDPSFVDEDPEHDSQTITGAATLGQTPVGPTRRYHFGIIRLVPGPIRLSVHTAGVAALGARLRRLKRRLGLTLVGFEDAPVELEPYVRHHPFETAERLRRSIIDHFRDELMWQAAAILGSVDFLGSPLGLLGDVSEGVSGLIRERSVGALVLNVAHGLSNSAAKVTETLGDGLGRVTMDDAHEEMRQRIRRRHINAGGAHHLVAGIKGLGFGLLGGATGIFKQVYEGASADGLQGVFSGLGKGLVGAVAKPVVGVLDLATETARAVRDSSRGSSRLIPDRRRPPRSTLGPGGLLPPYNPKDSRGQAYLRTFHRPASNSDSTDPTDLNLTEQYVAYECVRSGTDDLRVIVSSERIRVVTANSDASSGLTIVTETKLGELVACSPLTQDGRHYIEMTVRGTSMRRPLIRCDSEELARHVTRQINYAKRLHEEAIHTLRAQDD